MESKGPDVCCASQEETSADYRTGLRECNEVIQSRRDQKRAKKSEFLCIIDWTVVLGYNPKYVCPE
jgi:hypothetical protein